jgi:hypothetical protein
MPRQRHLQYSATHVRTSLYLRRWTTFQPRLVPAKPRVTMGTTVSTMKAPSPKQNLTPSLTKHPDM